MKLKYDEDLERYNNFTCGECFKIKINGKWKRVRIEIGSNGWYLIDSDGFTCSCKRLEGCDIRK